MSAYGKLVLDRQGRAHLATVPYGNYYRNKLLLHPYFLRLNGVPLPNWINGLSEGSADSIQFTWSYDYSVSVDVNYDPPAGGGSKKSGTSTFYAIDPVALDPTQSPAWESVITSSLSGISFDAGWTTARYETNGTRTTTRKLSNPEIIGFDKQQMYLYHYENWTRKTNWNVRTGVSIVNNRPAVISEPGEYKLSLLAYLRVSFETSAVNSGVYTLTRSDYPQAWPATKNEGKQTHENGKNVSRSDAIINFTVVRGDDGKLRIGSIDEYVEFTTKQISFDADEGFGGRVNIPAGFKARCKTTDLFAISL